MKRLPIVAVAINVALAFLAYLLTRLLFLAVNHGYFAGALSGAHLWEMLAGGEVFDAAAIAYSLAPYILLALMPLTQRAYMGKAWQRLCKWLYIVPLSVAVVMNLADTVYFRYTGRRTTSTVFSEFSGEGNLLGIFGTEMLRHWYLVLAGVAMIWLLWKPYVKPTGYHVGGKAWRGVGLQLVCLAVCGVLVVAGMRGGLAHSTRPITVSNANQYINRPTEAAIVLNTPFAILRTIGKNVYEPPRYFASRQALEAAYTPLHHPTGIAPHSTAGRLNVVVLIIESYGKEYMGFFNSTLDRGTYRGYTPFLDSIAAQSLTFSHSYANGRKSIDAMPSVLSGIPMMKEPFFLTPASMNNISGLADALGREGYFSAFFHGANNGSMGFQAFARATGFKKYVGRTEFDIATGRGDEDYDGMWAIWDEPFLQFMAGELGKYHEPFLATVFTASSHHPFAVPQKLSKQFPDEGKQPIHKCVRYTDMALKHFFDRAKRQPWYDNTLFVIVADHTNQTSHDEYQTDLGLYSVPIIFFTPGGQLKPQLNDDVIAQQADITPTVLGLLGYDKPYIAFGNDLLHDEPRSTWAFQYNNGIYQLEQGDLMLEWDGGKTTALYDFKNDRLLKNDIKNRPDTKQRQAEMETLLKALIQQYMERMSQDRLVP